MTKTGTMLLGVLATSLAGCGATMGKLETSAKITLNCKDSPITIAPIPGADGANGQPTHRASGCGRGGTYRWNAAGDTWDIVGFE